MKSKKIAILAVFCLVFAFGTSVFAKVNDLNKAVYVLLVHTADGTVYVDDTFKYQATASRAALNLETNGTNTWVIVAPSQFNESKGNESGSILGFPETGLFSWEEGNTSGMLLLGGLALLVLASLFIVFRKHKV